MSASYSWRSLAEKELKGKEFNDFLVWNNIDGITLQSWQDTLPNTLPQPPLRTTPWKILECITETDAQSANKDALNALMQGAEAIWFDKGYLGAAKEVVTKGIDQSIAPVFVRGENAVDIYANLFRSGESPNTETEGALLLDGRHIRERGGSPVQEVAVLLAQFIEVAQNNDHLEQVIIRTCNGSSFLTELSKLRALRWLLDSAMKHMEKSIQVTFISTNLSMINARNDEHTNILRCTTAGLAGAIGGADFVMINAWDSSWNADLNFSRRITRNIQLLLKEEGRFDKNLNPVDGAYFIEHLTEQIARQAWKQVQSIEGAGGFTTYTTSGALYQEIETKRNELLTLFTKDKAVLLGINRFQPDTVESEVSTEKSQYKYLPPLLNLPFELQNAVNV